MKKIVFVLISFISLIVLAVIFVSKNEIRTENSYLRIHVRANSNSEQDQSVKYAVKESVVDFLTPKIAEGSSFQQVYNILKDNLQEIEKVANLVLKNNGFNYTTRAKLNEEYFPTRSYGEYTLENGYYDALILELGSGKGNNWWCVVYPPLCFIGGEGNDYNNIRYKSKFVEIIKKFFA